MDKIKIKEEIMKAATNGCLECRKAFILAKQLECNPIEIGRICDEEKVKIKSCQLGCFD